MARDIESLGRTNTLQAVTRDITSLAGQMRQQDLQERDLVLRENAQAVNRDMLNMKREQQKYDNTLIPIDTALKFFDNEDVQKYVYQKAKSMGYLRNTGGQESIIAKDARTFLSVIMDPKNPYLGEIGNTRLQSVTSQLGQVDAALSQYKEKKPGADPAKDKNLAQLMEQKKILTQKRFSALQQTEQYKQLKQYIGKHTPESIQNFIDSGMTDHSLLKSIDLVKTSMKTNKPLSKLDILKGLSKVEREIAELEGDGELSAGSTAFLQSIDPKFSINIGADKKLSEEGKERLMRRLKDIRREYESMQQPGDKVNDPLEWGE